MQYELAIDTGSITAMMTTTWIRKRRLMAAILWSRDVLLIASHLPRHETLWSGADEPKRAALPKNIA